MKQFVEHSFGPVYDSASKVLILGSFPSVVSRQQNFYYANRTNRFWPVLEQVYGEAIKDRKQFCLDHGIALWDVIASCTIEGSADSTISDVKPNPLEKILECAPVHTIFTTGATAGKLYRKYFDLPVEHIALPSTSSANARMRLEDLTACYRVIKEKTDE